VAGIAPKRAIQPRDGAWGTIQRLLDARFRGHDNV